MDQKDTSRISRRDLLRRLGLGTAVVWLSPTITSMGSRANACEPVCFAPFCDWTCGHRIHCNLCGFCGPLEVAFCSQDIDGNCFCWEDWPCSELRNCAQNSDCPPGYACIPNTCCGTASAWSASGGSRPKVANMATVPKCLPGCGMGQPTIAA
jgi:hypothetical protein